MAKMMVNYATEVMGLTPDTSKTCEFTDVANQTEELQGYITEACQLGLMGVGITAFNPNGVVTRAQFGTVLSRVLYGDANDGGDPYYADHLAALQEAGIMTNISNPNAPEVRGYVMLMLQRAAGGTTPAVCETPENVLSCSLGLDTCPAECTTTTVKEGSLTVSSVGVDYTSIPKAGLVNFGSIKFVSDGTEITVNSLKIKNAGLATLDSATRIFFEKNGVRISGKASFTNNVATITFTTPLVVKSTETVDVTLLLSGSAGDEYQFNSTDVTATAQDVNGSWSSPSLRAANYSVLNIAFTATANSLNPKVDSTKLVELGQLNLTKSNSSKAVIVKAVTLNNSGTADLTNIQELALYRDDIKVSTKTIVDGKKLSFVLDNEIKDTETSAINYVVKGKIANADRVGETFNLYLKYTEDMTVVEKDTNFRTSFSGTTPATMGLITVAGGDLKFSEGNTASLSVVPGAKEVKFYEGTITAAKLVTLETFTVTGTAGTGWDKVLSNLYIKI
jgi:hypothetical protein